MAGMAASVGLFRRNIDGADRDTIKFDKTTQDVGRNIDKLSGRLGLLVDVAATLGPALIPTAAAAVPLLAGLSNQLGFVAIAGGSTILAFHGVGDALKALNEQQLNPSAANLEKLHQAMATLGPAGRDFVRQLQSMRPELQKLQTAAQAGLFPGMTEGITALTTRLPQAERIISEVTDTLGGLLADAGKSLAGPGWDDFFNMLETEARPTLQDLGESIGQVTKGLGDLWVAFAPLNRGFSEGMLGASKSFADWADGLSKTVGFQEFIAYLQQTGPQVAQTLGALSNALLQVLEAAAPLGGPALKAIEAFSDAIAAIANSNLGTPIFAAVAAWRAYSIAVTLAEKAQMRFNTSSAAGGAAAKGGIFSGYTSSLLGVTSAQERARTAAGKTSATISAQRGAFAKGAAGAALLGVAMTGVADKAGLSNTAMLGLTGFLVGGAPGAAFGATAGAALDLAHANDGLSDSLAKLNAMAGKVDFSTFNRQLSDVQKKIDDLKNVTSVGDALSDTAKSIGFAFAHPGQGHQQQVAQAEGQRDDAKQLQASATAWRNISSQVRSAGVAGQLAQHGFQLTAAGAREAAMSVEQFTFSIRGANAALTRQGTLDAYKSALLDFRDALKENGKTLDDNTRKGLANRAALRTMASSALEYAGNMKNAAHRTTFLQSARKDFINAATAAGKTRAAAKQLADQFGLVDRIHAKPTVEEQGAAQSRARIAKMRAEIERLKPKTVQVSQKGADDAKTKVMQLKAAIAALRDKLVHVTVVRNNQGGTAPGGGVKNQPGVTRLPADGGQMRAMFPGETTGPRDDTIPAMLSHREYVHNVASVDYYGERFMSDVNARRFPRPAGYADGGLVGFAGGGQVRAHGDHDGHNTLRDRIKRLTKAIDLATKSIDKERTARDDLVSRRNDLASTVGGAFTTDLFGQQPANLSWMNPAQKQAALTQGVFSTLKSDIANANTFKATLAGLKKRGLDGQALADLAASGDVQRAQAFSNLSQKDLGSYESLFNQRAAATAGVGAFAGNAVYGAQIVAQTKALQTLVAQNKALAAQLKRLEHKKPAKITVHESKNPKHTAKEVSRRQAMAG